METSKETTILTVEDNNATRKMISMYLKTRGYSVLEASSGDAGLEKVRGEAVDLLLLDLRLPGTGGLQVLAQVNEEFPELPVIVISGTEKISDVVEALRLGAWDYMLKPIQDVSVLLHSIKKTLERARLLKENQRHQQQLEEDIEKRTRELRQANISLTREIARRQRVEEALREREKAYRAIFNAATASLFILDHDTGAILQANVQACNLFEFQQEELTKLRLEDMIREQDIPRYRQFIEEVNTSGHAVYELETSSKNGSVFIHEAVGSFVSFMGKNRILIVLRDITSRKEAEEKEKLHHQQLIQADKMASLGILVSGVAHEINNPNNFIMVNAPLLSKVWKSVQPILENHFLEHGDFPIAPRVQYSEMKDKIPGIISGLLDGARRIKNFVNELKNFSRPTLPEIDNEIDVNKVIQSAVTLLTNLIGKSTRNFKVRYHPNLPVVSGNFQQLEQVIINLMENSCQALDDKSKGLFISTGLDDEQGMVKITVEDQGIGMEPETMERITHTFFTTKRESGGTGLGLSISSKIINNHQGMLVFNSTPGEGTTAEVFLPPAGKNRPQYSTTLSNNRSTNNRSPNKKQVKSNR